MTNKKPFSVAEEKQVREHGTRAPILGPAPADTTETLQRLMDIWERYEATLDAVRAENATLRAHSEALVVDVKGRHNLTSNASLTCPHMRAIAEIVAPDKAPQSQAAA